MTLPAFDRVVVACTSEKVDDDLLRWASVLASAEHPVSVLVASTLAGPVLQGLAPAARAAFSQRGSVSFHPLIESGYDAVVEAARSFQAGLLIVRHSKQSAEKRRFARRLLQESPCSLCFVPEGPIPQIRRVLAGIPLDSQGNALVAQAARLCSQIPESAMLAVHVCFSGAYLAGEPEEERFREKQLLALYRFMATAPLGRINCTPILEYGPRYVRGLLRVAKREAADLVIVGSSPVAGASSLTPVGNVWPLLAGCPVPVLRVHLPPRKLSLRAILKKCVFREQEPAYN